MDKALTFSERWNALCFESAPSDWGAYMAVMMCIAWFFMLMIAVSFTNPKEN